MSTFTTWNGPFSEAKPSTKDVLELIDAYNNVLSALNTHIAESAANESTVHGVITCVTSAIADLQETLTETINDNIATVTASVDSDVSELESSISTVKASLEEYTGQYVADSSNEILTFSYAIKSSQYFIGLLHALDIIDFTRLVSVTPTYISATSSGSSTTVSGYILGMLSVDWSDDSSAPTSYMNKAARAYIKFSNTSPLDAICDMVATQTATSKVGTLNVLVSKKANTWTNLAFHIIHGTSSTSEDAIYLVVSSSSYTSSSSMQFKVAGVNFIPVGADGYIAPNGNGTLLGTVTIGTSASVMSGSDVLRANTVVSDSYTDTSNNALITVDDTDITIGNSSYSVTFNVLPIYEDLDEGTSTTLSTKAELTTNVIPVGAIIRWIGDDPPTGYLMCNGQTITKSSYPELYAVIGSTVPKEDNSIIKYVSYLDVDS